MVQNIGWRIIKKDKTRVLTDTDGIKPEELPGVKKKSFELPYGGGEIWFEHLDGMYQYTDLVLNKLKDDAQTFCLPSKPGMIGFVLTETLINQAVLEEISEVLCRGKKRFIRVAFIGVNRQIRKDLNKYLMEKCNFPIGYFNDFEAAKQWLVS